MSIMAEALKKFAQKGAKEGAENATTKLVTKAVEDAELKAAEKAGKKVVNGAAHQAGHASTHSAKSALPKPSVSPGQDLQMAIKRDAQAAHRKELGLSEAEYRAMREKAIQRGGRGNSEFAKGSHAEGIAEGERKAKRGSDYIPPRSLEKQSPQAHSHWRPEPKNK